MTGMTMKYRNRLHRKIMSMGAGKYINAYNRTQVLDKYLWMNITEIDSVIKSLSVFNHNKSEVVAGRIAALTEIKYGKQIKMEAANYGKYTYNIQG